MTKFDALGSIICSTIVVVQTVAHRLLLANSSGSAPLSHKAKMSSSIP